jgi:hypothetical protein
MEYLLKRYDLNHIHISSYNSHTNGTVERSHFDVASHCSKSSMVIRSNGPWEYTQYFGQKESLLVNAWDTHHTSPSQELIPSSPLT